MRMQEQDCFLLNSEKQIGTDPSCRFWEKRKNHWTPTHSNSKKWRHRAED